MSTRIIIEKDGERYVGILPSDVFCKGDTVVEFMRKVEQICNREKLPPVVRTDNSAVIARLEADNAELREIMVQALRLAQKQRCAMCTVKDSSQCCDCVIEKTVKRGLEEEERKLAHGCASTQEDAE